MILLLTQFQNLLKTKTKTKTKKKKKKKTYKVTIIAYQWFSNCWSLTKVDLASSFRVIKYDAFARTCLEYDEFYLPENTETIDSYILCCTQIKIEKLASISRNPIDESLKFAYFDVESENSKYSNDEQRILYDKIKIDVIAVPGVLESFVISGTVVIIRSCAIVECIAKTIEFQQSVHVLSPLTLYRII